MQHMGDGEYSNKTAHCPFCKEKQKRFGVYKAKGSGQWQFKCHNPECVANNPEVGRSEIGYVALRKGIDQKQAALEFLKLAVPDILEAQERERKEKRTEDKGQRTDNMQPEGLSAEAPAKADSIPPVSGTDTDTPAPPPSDDPAPAPAPDNVVPFTPPTQPPPDPTNVWDALYRKLVLTPRDRKKLHARGFSDATIDTLGFKSNNQSNRIHVESLTNDFTMELLLETGIFRATDSEGQRYKDGPRPNSQLLGRGLKRKARKEGEKDLWDWTEPILIPYLKDDGTCFYLRPHKGGISPRDNDEEEDDEPTCLSHVYCPFLLAGCVAITEGIAILTEGEFKAAALFQCGIPSIAIPGTGFVRNPAFRSELLSIIRHFAIVDLIIVFDNEVKDDPAFPSRYKADPADRYDTAMWAEYIAIDLGREYFAPQKGSIRIGVLPDNLREDGKADFDSALYYFVRQRRDVERGTNEARKVFQKVIDDARIQRKARDLFPSESQRIIEHKLGKLFYKWLVPSGGDKELRFANQCQSNGELDVARAYRSVIGCYWERKGVNPADKKVALEQAGAASKAVERAKDAGVNGSEIRALRIKARAAWEHVHGLPVAVSDFTLTGHFKLYSAEGKADRLITIRNHNDKGKTDGKLYRISPEQLGRGPEFVCFMLGTGKGVWKGGARLLSHLQEDIDHQTYMRDIYIINFYGYHPDSKIWFFGDCAFGPNGDLIEADKYNIFWHAGVGYQVDSSVEERGSSFEQGAPLMLSPHGPVDKNTKIDLGELFHDFCIDMFFTIGNYDAWLMLGLVFAYGAAPEIFNRFGGHPSIWLAGITAEGKTTIARWLMRVWGFKHLTGIRINKGTTHVAMNRNLAQYSCLPVWFDEYRKSEIDPDKEAVLRGAFDRSSASKGLMDHSNRTRSARLFTTPIVSGESSSSDGATRSRYANIVVSKHRRVGDGTARMAKVIVNAQHYYLIGRRIMESRPKFVSDLTNGIEKFMSDSAVIKEVPNERMRLVYAAGYSAFKCTSQLIQGPGFEEREGMMNAFHAFLLEHAAEAAMDVTSETFLTRFWADVLSGLQRKKIKERFFDVREVHADEHGVLKEATAGDENTLTVCYVAPKALFDEYAQDLRSRNESPSLELGDLRRQMAKEKYFLPPPSREPRVHRASLDGVYQTCWVINLTPGQNGKSAFPFAEDLCQILNPNHRPQDIDAANAELAKEALKNKP
jgi:hypothetical protein